MSQGESYTELSDTAGKASHGRPSLFARLVRRDRALVWTQLVATAAVSIVRLEVLRRVAEWYVGRELALEAEVDRARNAVATTLPVALVRLLLLVLAHSSLERVEVELRGKVLRERSGRTDAHVVAL